MATVGVVMVAGWVVLLTLPSGSRILHLRGAGSPQHLHYTFFVTYSAHIPGSLSWTPIVSFA